MRKMMLTAACGLMLSGAAMADDLTECKADWKALAAGFAKDSHFKVVEFSKAQLAQANANYDAAPPVSTDTFTHIYTVEIDGDGMMIAFVKGDSCVVAAGKTDADHLAQLLKPDGI